ncbi:MAG: hypothetical protein M3198_04600 [Actinomycetota bacterium]|nr:hypothetical protein [Actinomycetota bacterium]
MDTDPSPACYIILWDNQHTRITWRRLNEYDFNIRIPVTFKSPLTRPRTMLCKAEPPISKSGFELSAVS